MDSKKMDIVMDAKVSVTVQLGTAELPMKEVVELSRSAQIQLKQNAKDPVSLLVNGKLLLTEKSLSLMTDWFEDY